MESRVPSSCRRAHACLQFCPVPLPHVTCAAACQQIAGLCVFALLHQGKGRGQEHGVVSAVAAVCLLSDLLHHAMQASLH